MRRALVIAGVMLAGLLALAPAVAAAAEAPIRDVKFELREGGFLVSVKSEISEEKVALSIYRQGEVAYYETPAEFTDDTVKARFGQLGELDYTFTPGPRPGCAGLARGTFEGTFDFTGENDYLSFEAPRAAGTFLGGAKQRCKEARAAAAAKEPAPPADEASLLAHDTRDRPIRSLVIFEGEVRHRPQVFFSAFQYEKAEGMVIARGAQTSGPRRDFTWNLEAGTAHIAPPAPFTGSATFKRRPGGHSVWRGSLTVPVLGGQPFRLAGSGFKAQLIKGSILD